MRIKISLLFLFAIAQTASAQLETNPASIQFNQINTPHFKMVFPKGLEHEGQRMANTLQYIHAPLATSLGPAPHKIPVLLQNQGTVSNGFVALSPRRSEFYTTSPQNYNLLGTNNWLNLLALHEYRHIVQYEKAYHSRAKWAYYPFGQNGLAAVSNMAVPNWFWEGDAVATETAYSSGGRGRIPDFNLLFRTNLLERGAFSYNKQHLGSFRDNVPNHYVTGYHMVTHVRRKHEGDVWGNIMQGALDNFYIPFTFSRAMRQQTGKRLIATYRSMVREVDSLWRQQADALTITPAKVLTKRKNNTYTDYLYPQPLADGSTVALKTGLSHIPVFVWISANGEQEKKLFTPGFMNNGPRLSVAQNKIVWTETEYDPRWGTRNYTVVKTFDIATKRHKVLTHQTRFSSAAFSADAKRIAVIEVSTANTNALVILDGSTGQEIKRIPSPENDFLAMPYWAPDGKSIVVLRNHENKRTISEINIETGAFNDLLPYTIENIGHPVIAGKFLLFNAPYNGIESTFALNTQTKKQYQVISRRYAGINAVVNPDAKTIVFNDFSAQGYNIARMLYDPDSWVPIEQVPTHKIEYFQPLLEQENNSNILANVPQETYPVEKYRRLSHAFNPHSWLPTVTQDLNEVSLAVQSQDILSTTVSNIGYAQNISERTGYAFAGVRYLGWYPVIRLTGSAGSRAAQDARSAYQWQEKSISTGLALPLNLTNSKYRESLNLATNLEVTKVTDYSRNIRRVTEQANGVLRSVNYQVTYQHSLRQNRRDLVGRYAQQAQVYYTHTPLGGNYHSNLFAASGRAYFPGFIRHHSFQLWGNYQKQDASFYAFSSPIRFPRGYRYQIHDNFYSFTTQYRFPILYPDLALGPILYFQRLKGNVFYDYGKGGSTRYQSVGVELSTDFNFMRLGGVLLDAGVRVSYLPQTNKPVVELIIANLGF
ncbi:hypothetical protein [Adhaeribacter aquaticus]|uniref:hypothetical protein n=1 Tax=Adhaeribacter aquaticus TaxID=299567 RepID=UPI000425EA5A|nr:hypothetical protein [Adhaeribacter aquaticus]